MGVSVEGLQAGNTQLSRALDGKHPHAMDAIGFGLSGERVLNTPRRGNRGSPLGWT